MADKLTRMEEGGLASDDEGESEEDDDDNGKNKKATSYTSWLTWPFKRMNLSMRPDGPVTNKNIAPSKIPVPPTPVEIFARNVQLSRTYRQLFKKNNDDTDLFKGPGGASEAVARVIIFWKYVYGKPRAGIMPHEYYPGQDEIDAFDWMVPTSCEMKKSKKLAFDWKRMRMFNIQNDHKLLCHCIMNFLSCCAVSTPAERAMYEELMRNVYALFRLISEPCELDKKKQFWDSYNAWLKAFLYEDACMKPTLAEAMIFYNHAFTEKRQAPSSSSNKMCHEFEVTKEMVEAFDWAIGEDKIINVHEDRRELANICLLYVSQNYTLTREKQDDVRKVYEFICTRKRI